MKNILFICLGNICRSSSAQGYFRKIVDEAHLSDIIEVDSAGTSDWHIGQPPDERAIEAALQRNVDLSVLRGRQVAACDFVRFNYIIAMDDDNVSALKLIGANKYHHKIHLLLSFAKNYSMTQVPDPYYSGESGFNDVLDMIEDASEGLLKAVLRRCDAKD